MTDSPNSQRSISIVSDDDARLAHLASNPAIDLPSGDIANHWPVLRDLLRPSTEAVHVYNFDGELDDQIRLEHLLLVFQKEDLRTSNIILVAGKRIDGADTKEEVEGIVRKTLDPSTLNDEDSVIPSKICIVQGAPIKIKGPEDEETLARTVKELGILLQGRPFVFHNNTSAVLPRAILQQSGLSKTLKAMTNTCGIATPASGIFMGANASWDLPAYLDCLEMCRQIGVPYISMHGSLSGWSRISLPELDGWAETMLRPVETKKQQEEAQAIIRFAMAMPLVWTIRLYAWATQRTYDKVKDVVAELLSTADCHPVEGAPRPSDEWSKWGLQELGRSRSETLTHRTVAARLRSIATNLSCPYSNTIGDVSACVVDALRDEDDAIALAVGNLQQSAGEWRMELASESNGPSQHYVIAYANESATLDAAWHLVKDFRDGRKVDQPIQIIDNALKAEWVAYSDLMARLLQGVLQHRERFTLQDQAFIESSLDNLQHGKMAEVCSDGYCASI